MVAALAAIGRYLLFSGISGSGLVIPVTNNQNRIFTPLYFEVILAGKAGNFLNYFS